MVLSNPMGNTFPLAAWHQGVLLRGRVGPPSWKNCYVLEMTGVGSVVEFWHGICTDTE